MINIIYIQVCGVILTVFGYVFISISNVITEAIVDFFPMTEEYFQKTRENPDALFYRDPVFSWFYEWNEWVKSLSYALSIVGLFLLLIALVELIRLNSKKDVAKERDFSFSSHKLNSKN